MRVLVMVHDYPPVGGGGVQRVLHLVRAIVAAGHSVHVVAVDRDPGPLRDDSLLLAHPATAGITRYRIPPLDAVIGAFRRLRMSRLPALVLPADLYPSATVFSRTAASAALCAAKTFAPDVVVASSPPYGICESGRRVAVALGLPLVLDLRDPWVEPEISRSPSALAFRWARAIQRRCLRRADLVVVTAPTLKTNLEGLARSRPRRVVTITNGFDPGRREDLAIEATARSLSVLPGVRTVAFVGRMFQSESPAQGRFRVADRVFEAFEVGPQILRTSDYHAGPWFKALSLLARKRPDLKGRLRTLFVGDGPQQSAPAGLADVFPIEYVGYQPVGVASAVMRQADGLLLFNNSTVDDSPSPIIHGKLFEYLAAGPPIFAMCGPGDTVALIQSTGAGIWSHDKRPEDMAGYLESWLDGRDLGLRRNEAEIARFSREDLGRRFVHELEQVVAQRTASAGAR